MSSTKVPQKEMRKQVVEYAEDEQKEEEVELQEKHDYTKKEELILESELYRNAIELLVEQWETNRNYNAFLLAQLITKCPTFLLEESYRKEKIKNKDMSNLKVPLWNRLCNKMMNYSHNTTGKKVKQERLLSRALRDVRKSEYPTLVLLKALLYSVPNEDVRRLPHGSGVLTKAVQLTVSRKITWFLKTLVAPLYRSNKKFEVKFNQILDEIFALSPKSEVLKKKRELQTSALKAQT